VREKFIAFCVALISGAWSKQHDKVMIVLEKPVLDRLWHTRRSDNDTWSRLVEELLGRISATPRQSTRHKRTAVMYQVEILGESFKCTTAIDALVWCLQTLARLDDHLLEKVAKAVKTRSRNHIARSKFNIYPMRPDLAANARTISDGWFIGSNISNQDKLRIVHAACKVAGLQYGTDVKWLA
jgi:hypothetical protein